MEKDEIKKVLIRCIKEIQELNGLPPADINDATRPVGVLKGFDSLIMVELAVQLSSQIGLDLDDEMFYDEPNSPQGRKLSRPIQDMVEKIYQFMASQRG
jgi:acyl carrier protein